MRHWERSRDLWDGQAVPSPTHPERGAGGSESPVGSVQRGKMLGERSKGIPGMAPALDPSLSLPVTSTPEGRDSHQSNPSCWKLRNCQELLPGLFPT